MLIFLKFRAKGALQSKFLKYEHVVVRFFHNATKKKQNTYSYANKKVSNSLINA